MKKKAELFDASVERIVLSEADIKIRLNTAGLAKALYLPEPENERTTMMIGIPAMKVWRGHELRLIIPGANSSRNKPTQRDPKLITLIAEALAAHKLIEENPDQSIASIAEEHSRCRTRLGKLVRISCLAPDIVQSIVEGQQPSSLNAKVLTGKTLPIDWNEQRKVLGIT